MELDNEIEYRFYTFVNFYLSSIQQGIQTGHCAVRLMSKYLDNGNSFNTEIADNKVDMVRLWAYSYETFIVLNGGAAEDIEKAVRIVSNTDFPHAWFVESEQALAGLTTCVGIVLPETIFNAKLVSETGEYVYIKYSDDENDGVVITYAPDHRDYALLELVKGCRLAS